MYLVTGKKVWQHMPSIREEGMAVHAYSIRKVWWHMPGTREEDVLVSGRRVWQHLTSIREEDVAAHALFQGGGYGST
jgi:hypothetical protein